MHILVCDLLPPIDLGFGPPNRLANRNHEIRVWKDYINGESYLYDDQGNTGVFLQPESEANDDDGDSLWFVIAGDLSADPFDGESVPGAAQLLLDDPLINTDLTLSS